MTEPTATRRTLARVRDRGRRLVALARPAPPAPDPAPERAAKPAPGPRRPKRTFVLGVGAQKAGTTWLYSYLRNSKHFAHGYRKEYHVFDSRDVPTEEWMRDRILRMADEELQKARRGEPADAEQLHRASMYADPRFYYDYFDGLLSSKPHFRTTGDVTPDYALLSPERLADIKRQFRRRGIRTVAVFLMRDPVERIYSQVRMQQGRNPDRFEKPAEEMVAELYDGERYRIRTQYEHTLRSVDEVFGPDEVHFGFYETLFEPDEVRRIADLAGIGYHEPDFSQRRNMSQRKADGGLDEELVKRVAQHYGATYEAVAARFPAVDLTRIWPSASHVL